MPRQVLHRSPPAVTPACLPARLRWLAVLALAFPFFAGACFFGGDSDEEPTPTPGRGVAQQSAPGRTPASTPIARSTPVPPSGPVVVTYGLPFVWPAQGPLTSLMSPEHPNGIDIGLDAGGSLTVRAAAAGTVVHAGGSDSDALGLSIVIDHGNGIETTYGHLSTLSVSLGDTVSTGETLGIGGATGNASGVHLHFEVRKDGQTVDPMDVLPSAGSENHLQEFDCDSGRLVLPAGASAVLDLSRLLSVNESVVDAEGSSSAPDAGLQGVVESRSQVLLVTALNFDGPDRLEEHRLDFTIDSPEGNRSLTCRLAVQHRSVPTTFYVRAASASGDAEGHVDPEAEAEPEPEPTPVPTPTSSLEPHYSAPVTSNPTAVPPSYAAPGVSAPVVQQPDYSSPPGAAGP